MLEDKSFIVLDATEETMNEILETDEDGKFSGYIVGSEIIPEDEYDFDPSDWVNRVPVKGAGIPFRPVRGSEKNILAGQPKDGYLYFATDTKKIYIAKDNLFLPMGGNSSIHYGKMELDYEPDSDEIEFDFMLNDIEGNEPLEFNRKKVPNKDDLILNIPDGCFYRVIAIENTGTDKIIKTNKLTIAGSGSGGSGGGGGTGSSYRIVLTDSEKTSTKYYSLEDENFVIKYNLSLNPHIEGNYIVSIDYMLGKELLSDFSLRDVDFGDFTFDFKTILNKLSTSVTNTLGITVVDSYGTRKTFYYYINIVELRIQDANDSPILFNFRNVDADGKENYEKLRYRVFPYGGSRLINRKITYRILDQNLGLKDTIEKTLSSVGGVVETDIDFKQYEHGAYVIEAYIEGQFPGSEVIVYSNIISSQVIYFDSEINTTILTAKLPSSKVEQYSTLSIPYMIGYDPTSGITKVNINTKMTSVATEITEEKVLEPEVNKYQTWDIYFDTVGRYILELSYGTQTIDFGIVEILPYEGDLPVIDNTISSLQLNLTATNRNNSEINKDKWTYNNYTSTLSNFKWGNINGWMKDEDGVGFLRLTSGATVEIDNYYPFATDAASTGLTIELDFKVSGILDYSRPLMTCLSYTSDGNIHVGYHVTGQASTMNSAAIKATGGEIVEGEDEADKIYNTAIQGLTAKFTEDERIHLSWVIERRDPNSDLMPLVTTYLNGVVSGMTQYGSTDQFLQIATSPAKIKFDSSFGDIDIYNIRVYNTALDKRVILNNFMATYGSNEERLNIYKDNLLVDDAGEISLEKIESGDYQLKIPYIKLTGGSSLNKWAVTNEMEAGGNKLIYRLPQAKKDYRLMKFEYVDPSNPNKNLTEDIELTNETTGQVVYAPEEIPEGGGGFVVTKGCQVYGQGTSSMEYPVKNLRVKFRENEFVIYDGAYPVDLLCFKADYMESSGSHNTGTANLIYNLYSAISLKTPAQKFYNSTNWGYDVVTAIRGYPVVIFYSPSGEPGSYEFVGKYNLNMDKATHEPFGFVPYPKEYDSEASNKFGWDDEGKETIHCYEFLNNASALANFRNENEETFEETFFKEVENEDKELVPNWTLSYESRYPEDKVDRESVESFFRMANWVNSTKDNLDKFKEEFEEYFDLDFAAFYYIITHVLLMIDSRAKNMMIATWDNQKWYPIFYDMDTMLGLNNYGYNKFNYNAEDSETGLYNGENSILWNNFKRAFPEKIGEMYRLLRNNGLNYTSLLNIYNIKQADAWNEALCNADAIYKYVRPFTEGYYDGIIEEVVQPGTRNYLYAGQGRRSMHRQWWLSNRLNFFDGKHLRDSYKNNKFTMRIYTSTAGGKDSSGNEWVVDPATEKSYEVVPPSSSFTITPLQDQYLALAPGGDNAATIGPIYTKANTPQFFEDNKEYIDTETYIYGASLLKDIGDLSNKYFGKFEISSGVSRLENLILGNPHNDYYNKNFGSLNIGKSLPYLKYLNIMNCKGLSGELDLSGSTRLEKVLATGTQITSVNLSDYGILEELRLPSTISTFVIKGYPSLTNDNFTIGTCNYSPIEKTYTYINNFSSLVTLNVEETPIDSYTMIKSTNNLNQYKIIDFIWRITDINDVTLGEDGNISKINILDRLLELTPYKVTTHAQALSGEIIIAIPGVSADELTLYNEYILKYPNVKISYDLDAIGESGNIKLAYDINFKDGSNDIYWTKKTNAKITDDFFDTSANGALKAPVKASSAQYHYDFYGWRANDGTEFLIDENDPLGIGKITGYINGIEKLSSNITFTSLFNERIRTFNIIFKDEDKETVLLEKTYKYGELIKNPSEIYPYKDSSELALKDVWKFAGFVDTFGNNINEQEIKATADMAFFATYEIVPVYENIISEDYIYIDGSNSITQNSNISDDIFRTILKGKITLPTNNAKSISSGLLQLVENVTHVFFENNNNNSLTRINSYAFDHLDNVIYIEIPNSVYSIGTNAFAYCKKIKYIGPSVDSIDTTKRVVKLAGNITTLESEIFKGNGTIQEIEIGDSNNPWELVDGSTIADNVSGNTNIDIQSLIVHRDSNLQSDFVTEEWLQPKFPAVNGNISVQR